MHVLEIIFGHLEVHLVLEGIELLRKLPLLEQNLQFTDQALLRFLPTFSVPQKRYRHVLARWCRVKYHHFYAWDLLL